jgi:hypothetical protein
MTPRLNLRKLRSSALIAGLLASVGICVASPSFAIDEMVAAAATADFIPGSDRASTRPPATFFSINAVLAKLDRQRGRGPDAVRLASLTPSNVATDVQPPLVEAPAVGKKPFGLFTFRAPEGLLWRKWRGVEAAMRKEQTVFDQCRTGSEGCPSYAEQFLRLINAVKVEVRPRATLTRPIAPSTRPSAMSAIMPSTRRADRWSTPLAFATAKATARTTQSPNTWSCGNGIRPDQLPLSAVSDRRAAGTPCGRASRRRWLILDNRRSELIDDTDASNFTPLFTSTNGVQLFAAPAKQLVPDSKTDAAPAASIPPVRLRVRNRRGRGSFRRRVATADVRAASSANPPDSSGGFLFGELDLSGDYLI